MVQLTNVDVGQHLAQRRERDKEGEGVYLIGGVAYQTLACPKSQSQSQ